MSDNTSIFNSDTSSQSSFSTDSLEASDRGSFSRSSSYSSLNIPPRTNISPIAQCAVSNVTCDSVSDQPHPTAHFTFEFTPPGGKSGMPHEAQITGNPPLTPEVIANLKNNKPSDATLKIIEKHLQDTMMAAVKLAKNLKDNNHAQLCWDQGITCDRKGDTVTLQGNARGSQTYAPFKATLEKKNDVWKIVGDVAWDQASNATTTTEERNAATDTSEDASPQFRSRSYQLRRDYSTTSLSSLNDDESHDGILVENPCYGKPRRILRGGGMQ